MAVIRDRYQLDVDVGGAIQGFGTLKTTIAGFIAALAVREVVQFGQAIIDNARQFEQYNNQLRLITANNQELADTFQTLYNASRNNRSDFGETVNLYTKLNLATETLGKSQEEVLSVTQKFQQALAISGADANTAAGAIRQFGQAMGSGVVRGDEFVSIVEALGPALNIMARESGLTVGQLRELSQEGKLTADAFFTMIQQSDALTAAFNAMEITTDQLETRLGDTFDLIVKKVDEAVGFTDNYRRIIRELDRDLGNLFNVNPLENLTDDQIFRQVEQNILGVDDALFEIQQRIKEFPGLMNLFTGNFVFDSDQQAFNSLKAIEQALIDLREQAKITNEETQRQVQAEREAAAARTAALAPLQDLIQRSEQYVDANERGRSALERLRDSQAQVLEDIDRLNSLRGTEIEQYLDLDQLIATATLRNEQITESIRKLTESTRDKSGTFEEYYNGIIESAARAARETEYAVLAMTKLNEDLAAGRINVDTYANAVARLDDVLGNTDAARERTRVLEEQQRVLEQATERTNSYINDLSESTEDARFELEALNMDPLQRQIQEITRDLNRNLSAEVERLNKALADGADPAQIQAQIDAITAATQRAITAQTDIARQSYETQRSFSYGWEKAFDEYTENATNAAQTAERLFDKMASGMEDAIVGFAKTGKFEFKDFLATIAEEILRSQVRILISRLFGNTINSGGGTSSRGGFAGLFANGGTIPSGQFGIVGEAGPEIVTGPATVTPMGAGGGTVIYNINAVDAPSFQQLVARDPKFIHAVAEKGRQGLAGVRR